MGYISCPSTIKLPCAAVFESDTVEAGQGSVPKRGDPSLMWQRGTFAPIGMEKMH